MNLPLWSGLLVNAALLLALVSLYDLLTLRPLRRRPTLEQTLSGLGLGLVTLAVMAAHVTLRPGLIFDTRSILLSLAGLFFGTTATLLAAAAAAAFRLSIGGPGTAMGVAVIALSALTGVAWRHLRRGDLKEISPRELGLLGLTVHLFMLACTALLPEAVRAATARDIALPVLVLYPAATVVVGLFLRTRLERKHDHEALRESESRLKDIVEHSTNLFYSHTPEHVLTYVSPQSRYFLGCSPEEAKTRWTEFVTDHPVNARGYEATVRAIETGLAQPPYELELKTKDGRVLWVEVHEAPVVRGGKTVAIVGALSDITDRKRAEEERLRLQSQLEAAHRLEALGRLAGGVAHDFNNFLNIITIHTEVLARQSASPQLRVNVEEIRSAAHRAARLVKQLLAFARRQPVQPQRFDLREAVSALVPVLETLAGGKGRLTFQCAPDRLPVRMDPGQVDQILTNLVANARDAAGETGALVLRVDSLEADGNLRRRYPFVRPGRYAQLQVEDDGPGVPADLREKIFEPFFTTKGEAGTGLGLATVYGIAKQNEGFVVVEEAPSGGALFRVGLPLEEGEAPPSGD